MRHGYTESWCHDDHLVVPVFGHLRVDGLFYITDVNMAGSSVPAGPVSTVTMSLRKSFEVLAHHDL